MKRYYLLLVFLWLSSCKFFRQKDIVVRNDFKLHNQANALCFDFQDDEHLKASFIIKSGITTGDHTMQFPFQIKDVDNAEDIWSTSASYSTKSIINFKLVKGPEASVSIIRFQTTPSEILNELVTDEDLPNGLYLKRSGLDRKFIFKYEDVLNQPLYIDTIGLIGVKLPKNAVGKEISHGMTTSPQPIFEDEQIKYFKAMKVSKAKVLKMGYTLPLNANQQQLFDLLVKILTSFAIPAIEVIFIHSNSNITPARKKRIKWGLFGLQLIVISILFWLIYLGSISGQSMADAAILIISALITLLIAIMKG